MSRTLISEPYCLGSINIPLKQPLNWDVNNENCALLIHDMQRYFVNALSDEPSKEMTSSISNILQWARKNDVPVFYSAQPGRMSVEQRGLLSDLWGPGMRTTEEDRKIIEELSPRQGDVTLTKWRYSAFHHSDLLPLLRSYGRNSLLITGIYASVGLVATAIDAFSNDIRPFVVADAIADFTLEGHQKAVNYLSDNCARVITTSEILSNE
ncbi:isochorismatase family protein [Vibrio sp. Of7-15]|uniref:isochorismatase family protein n=1 Tax=Vibrio sp. Of7-15 TaxID=2724879 RepID=UPI001EF39A96|nr:isochorismatase family protein [Vibrio sp. Of7-15]MCG7500089.1 isochorismatase family protein [Vibrio sp. Of7-15]